MSGMINRNEYVAYRDFEGIFPSGEWYVEDAQSTVETEYVPPQSTVFIPVDVYTDTRGERYYEGKNHLGNVLVVFSDRKIPEEDNGQIAYYTADVVSYNDYWPYGWVLDGRHGGESYRFSFQEQEGDPEIKGENNSINYKYRMHDTRVGRFFAVDPLTGDYPHYTPYSFSGNKVIYKIELEGLEEANTASGYDPYSYLLTTQIGVRKVFDGNGLSSNISGFLDFGANAAGENSALIFGGGIEYNRQDGFSGSLIVATQLRYGGDRSYPTFVNYGGESFNNIIVNDFQMSTDFGVALNFNQIEGAWFREVGLHFSGKYLNNRLFGNIMIWNTDITQHNYEMLESPIVDINTTGTEFNVGYTYLPNMNIGDRGFTIGYNLDQRRSWMNFDYSYGAFQALFQYGQQAYGNFSLNPNDGEIGFGSSINYGGQFNYYFRNPDGPRFEPSLYLKGTTSLDD
jgi:hypothetical protein